MELLIKHGFIEQGEHWKMIADHYTVKGKQIDNKKLATAIGNAACFNKDGKPKQAKILEAIVSDIYDLEK